MISNHKTTLILGGGRSGKTAHALALGEAHGGTLLYIATAEPGDGEMAARIAHHRQERGHRWVTIEEPVSLVAVVAREARPERFLLVDCLTLWISNLMAAGRPVAGEVEELEAALKRASGHVCLVSNEVGLGIVPDNLLARRFRDEAGRTHQKLATSCDEVLFMVAGLALRVK